MSEQDDRRGADPGNQLEETVQSLADIHEEHEREVGSIQKLANGVTRALGQPVAVFSVLMLIVAWIVGNVLETRSHGLAIDRFPFPDLALFATVSAFLATLLILTTQRHEQDVARRRDQLTLHMAVLTEKKIAKVIELLEEQRRDSAVLPSREDTQADEMAQPANPAVSLEKIEQTSLKD
jgi:uncharacterized membrane protein